MVRIRSSRRVAIVLAAAALAAAACSSSKAGPPATTAPPATEATTTTTEAPLEAGEKVYEYTPQVGDCFDLREEQDDKNKKTVTFHLKLDCSLPHESEVFAVIGYADPATPDLRATPYPGDDALRRFARLECPKQYAPYVGRDYELSTLTLTFVLPQPANWPKQTQIGCALGEANGKRRAGTARGAQL